MYTMGKLNWEFNNWTGQLACLFMYISLHVERCNGTTRVWPSLIYNNVFFKGGFNFLCGSMCSFAIVTTYALLQRQCQLDPSKVVSSTIYMYRSIIVVWQAISFFFPSLSGVHYCWKCWWRVQLLEWLGVHVWPWPKRQWEWDPRSIQPVLPGSGYWTWGEGGRQRGWVSSYPP